MSGSRWSVVVALALLGASVSLAAEPAAKEAKKTETAVGDDAKDIEGTWKVVSLANDGSPRAESEMIFVIGGGKITPIVGGKAKNTGRYDLDATTTPKSIDLLESPRGIARGIYSLSGDELKMCIAEKPGAPRPTKFEPEATSGTAVVVLKRQSREWKHPAAAEPETKEAAAGEAKEAKLVKVSGTVNFKDGTLIPVPEQGEGVLLGLNFRPFGDIAAGQPRKGANAVIDDKGHFDVMTLKAGDGMIPGKYSVRIFGSSVPEKYTKPETSGLEFDIQKPTSDLLIELDKP
jgi:uncharacterized protein (TIGR03067 family)